MVAESSGIARTVICFAPELSCSHSNRTVSQQNMPVAVENSQSHGECRSFPPLVDQILTHGTEEHTLVLEKKNRVEWSIQRPLVRIPRLHLHCLCWEEGQNEPSFHGDLRDELSRLMTLMRNTILICALPPWHSPWGSGMGWRRMAPDDAG